MNGNSEFYGIDGMTLEKKLALFEAVRSDSVFKMHNCILKGDYTGFLRYNSKYWVCEYNLDLLYSEKRASEKKVKI